MNEAVDIEAQPIAAPSLEDIDAIVADAAGALNDLRKEDGHLIFELEADCTISAEYIMLNHYLDEREPDIEGQLANYIREVQTDEGFWPLFHEGEMDISASVKGYFALKLAGDDPDAPHMVKARQAILNAGGAEKANIFTRYSLALFEQVPWRAVPVMPIELMLMPRWFPINLWKMSYWSRTVIGPLLIMAALKPKAINPLGIDVQELFVTPPAKIKTWLENSKGTLAGSFFLGLDKVLRVVEPLFPKRLRKRAIQNAVDYITPRLNGEDGIGGIFPAMANTVMAFEALGYPKDHPDLVIAKKSVKKLLSPDAERRHCQPCLSPVWDTALSTHALMESGQQADDADLNAAFEWLKEREVTELKGDWAVNAKPDVPAGGWAFQYVNDYFPDYDDTSVVAMAMHRADPEKYKESIDRAAQWILGNQSSNGGWAAFDIDNDAEYLNAIPFADHGALLDPPTEDTSARCISFLSQIGYTRDHPAIARGLQYLRDTQQEDGSWYGRWGTNYIYGTWSVLCAFNAAGEDPNGPHVRKGVEYLYATQQPDGGWGEDCATYDETQRGVVKASTPSQTGWALIALMASGEVDDPRVQKGIRFLMQHQRNGAKWEEELFTAVGFPRVFYLRYHGYSAFFPLWALARYANLRRSNSNKVSYGM